MLIHTDCRYYKGDLPCIFHKNEGVHCDGCSHHDPVKEKILIIKLGAIGDVIRTTPLLHRLRVEFPHAQIHWLSWTPEMVPNTVDRIYRYELKNIEILKEIKFDILFNLDKDREACALANQITADIKKGFELRDGNCYPMGDSARQKWITGLFDDENQKNTKSYPVEIFEICGYSFNGEEYILNPPEKNNWDLPKDKPIIGLNTGCGVRWETRLWPEAYWEKLAVKLLQNGFHVLFLGGEQEHEKNIRLSQKTGGLYAGHFTLSKFIDLMDQCDLIVTAVTMALHLALGLRKKLVLFNNIFNAHEFELYNRGIILEPDKPCKGCFKNTCDEQCMELISPDEVYTNIKNLFI